MLPLLTRAGRTALGLLFPCWCLGCGREGSLICDACRLQLPEIEPPLCPRCGIPQPGGILCSICRGNKHNIDAIRSPFRFEGLIRQAVHQFKYNNLRSIARPLARLLGEYLANNPISADIIVPVPLHNRRLRERGYNQSELLAKELSNITRLPLVKGSLVRQIQSQPQARAMPVTERRKNVDGAFACRGDNLKDRDIVLIDDVATSGATLDACAAAMKAAGSGRVQGLTLAREV